MSSLGKKVLESGGIVTDVTAHGERRLAYEIRRPGVTFGEVGFCLLAFFFFISIFASNIDWRCALVTARAKRRNRERKRGELKGASNSDLDGDGLKQKKENSTSTSFSPLSSPLFLSSPLILSLFSGVHLAARVRGPGLGPPRTAQIPGPRRQGAPLGAAGEERPRAQGADDGCRRQGSAEETCGELREERRTIFLFALSFFPPPHFIHYSARCVFADERGRESGQFLFIFRFSSSSLETNGDSDGDDDKNFSFSFLANDERIFFKKNKLSLTDPLPQRPGALSTLIY